ncbi:hypothetical protein [Kribbella sindirgiensis]|uniref:Lipoprotein n=1 Tax=Kribbella sindirgiensis TaxID=1124744 RepID=A0A4R0HZH9_9ACTN|nr:hypothetical protein [Kribbella sindirgiensis]TCC19283.1 hypothetical protein E0H50_38300 [Kribbella sindirgiensis]
MKRIAALALVAVLAGCSTVDSKDIRTSGITANYVVTLPETADAARVSASYRVGTLTFVELGDGESVTSSGGGKDVTLKHHRSAGVTDYDGQLDGVVDAGTEITFNLTRGKDDDSAPRSTVKLPDRVRLTAPLAGTTYSRRAAIPIRFGPQPSDEPSILTWAGDCIQSGTLELEPARTSATIPAGSIRPTTTTPTPGIKPPTTCPIDITLTHRTEGTLDKAFKDGHITAESQSVRRITSAP